ncbi:transposase [Psychromonas sp. SA13A]|uniref:transposase n=1 Tax=Psychromonas sp. SA13A TaxID=2686346 RepID=UPI00140E4C81|nr:transposase [Psychromonas sp. SA13A]
MHIKSLLHINHPNAIQFVTFRTQESLSYYLQHNNIDTTDSAAKQQLEMDKILDVSKAGAILNGSVIELLMQYLLSKNNSLYQLIAVSIMPNHVHIMFEQLAPLAQIMQNVKGGSSLLINRYLDKSGVLWDKSYYDKIVRTEVQFKITYEYIKNNAYKAELADAQHRFYGIYE